MSPLPDEMRLHEHPGYAGMFTRHQMPGAIANGTRIVKTASEPGDANPDGTLGTVLGSVGHPDVGNAYFVEWDTKPRVACLVRAHRITKAPTHSGGTA
jgi:hypothetical protein